METNVVMTLLLVNANARLVWMDFIVTSVGINIGGSTKIMKLDARVIFGVLTILKYTYSVL